MSSGFSDERGYRGAAPTGGAGEPVGEKSGVVFYLIAVGTIQLHRHEGREVLRQQQRREYMRRQQLYQQAVGPVKDGPVSRRVAEPRVTRSTNGPPAQVSAISRWRSGPR